MKREKNDQQSNAKKKSIASWVRFFLSLALVVIAIFVIFNYVPFVAKYDYYRILTGSMDPVIKVNEVVVIDTSINHENLQIGDIIAFYADINNDGTDEIVVHYLDAINQDVGVTTYKTKPEVSNQEDSWTLSDDDIIGIHVLTLPKFFGFLTSTFGKVILIVDVIVVYVIIESFFDNNKKNIKKTDNSSENKEME